MTREIPPLIASAAETEHFLQVKEQRLAKSADLITFFDATAELRCSPAIFEHDEPGARSTLVCWAAARNMAVEERTLPSVNGKLNRVTSVTTHHHHRIDVHWTAP